MNWVPKCKSMFLLLVSLLVFLSACSSGGGTQDAVKNEAAGGNNGKKVQLQMWFWQGASFEKIIPEFNRTHPNIEIVPQIYKWEDAHKKLLTAMSAGSGAPDIAMIDISQMDQFLKYPDKFYDLNEYGAKDLSKDYLDWKWKQGSAGSKQLGFPTDIGPMVLYYRQDLFQQAGLPSEPNDVAAKIKNWDDFLAAGKTLKEKTGASILSNPYELYGAIRDQGNELYFDKDENLTMESNPQIKKALDYYKKAREMGIAGAYDQKNALQEYSAALNSGKIATYISAAWGKGHVETRAPDTKGKWRAAKIPEGTGNMGGSFLLIPKETKNAKEAYTAISWMLSPQQQLEVFKISGNFPSTPSVYGDKAFTETGYEFWGNQKLGVLFSEVAKDVKVQRKGPFYQTVEDIISDGMQAVTVDKTKDPDKEFAALIEKAKTKLKNK
ncbi:ABC transporter substrate-binding protein [Paenibacillus alginolyticus]|uniref:Extracellular solute-binding protein n=1 Tax=Paenibacillus alginolyticus TaxID=59839 RepID=A0ABT4G766_9BACL|nr:MULTISPECIES: extracellular solute-binding protein [Paenibacillus]MCY9692024.1 extracellular solute-binding protein [Paenibacillus alginolyticus]MEC0144214.1 extracellular solute-binding protein [Paenibacillus alginolyticus]NRF92329.1 extracellular solute-binding protein [Paenibacillus frigoriresistens]